MTKLRRLLFLFIFICLCLLILIIKYNFHQIKWEASYNELRKNDELFHDFESLEETRYPLCSYRSTKHGFHQRVIGISAYRSAADNIFLTDKIWSYILEYISEAESNYPDWRVRIYYHNLNKTTDELIQIEKVYKNVDFCDVFNIPLLGNLSSYMFGRLHRFVAIADRFVDIYMSRDIDSPILKREVISVNEWLLSNKLFHIIRDHPHHFTVMLAGLWAFKTSINKTITKQITQYLLSKSMISCYDPSDGDQDFLQNFVWPIAEKESIQHDSFHCQLYNYTIPFSIPKLSLAQFVGCRRPCKHDQESPGPCPKQCQSPNHTDPNLC